MAVIADSSVLIQRLNGRPIAEIDDALQAGTLVLPPLVIAELITGASRQHDRHAIAELLQEAPMHWTDLAHWIRVGELRRDLLRHGVNVTTPDAHIAQCALDLHAILLSRDAIFMHVAKHTKLRFHRCR